MKEKIKIKNFISNKRFIVLSSFVFLVTLLTILNISFSAFTNRETNKITNIKVSRTEYGITINGTPGTIITVAKNKTTRSNIVITSLNEIDSKYELIYKVCSNASCNSFINKPAALKIDYSSKTLNPITGVLNKTAAKQMRIAITNTSATTYYIKLEINAGYTHNTLALQNLITTIYDESDVINTKVNGVSQPSFPTIKGDYTASVACETVDEGPSNVSGTVTWNGSKWNLNLSGYDLGRTICNVDFKEPNLREKIIAQGGGVSAIVARGRPDFNETNGISGIYAMADEYGTSYYYRGLKTELNNNLIWGGFQWKIVRINGNGSVRLIYNGTEAQFNSSGAVNDTGANTQISGEHAWNSTNYKDAKYVGYMYGGANGAASTMRNGTTSVAATYNQTSTNMKTVLENWYQTNISGKPFESSIVDNLFCNDRQLQSEVGGASTGPGYGNTGTITNYAALQRLETKKAPTLKCGLKNDRFTKNDKTRGNGNLTHSVGLLTADEAALAGLHYYTKNSTNYLYTNHRFWLFSPECMHSNGNAYVLMVSSSGNLLNYYVDSSNGVRPAVSIKSETRVTGTGSNTDPYKVAE